MASNTTSTNLAVGTAWTTADAFMARAISIGGTSAEEKVKNEIKDLEEKLEKEKKQLKTINRLKELDIDVEILKEILIK